ncbi:hypothetical protein [Thalassobellus suaedae]|uniref:Uncharacterized protein n=1 Tax=Thalassobellus suaedae TaxID=3074124 RepID=A0ABY9XUM7_9FLAO|nr:hypothetical protein RHP51_02540 [Flavobacteriaceae bacterium HL-DH14]
MKRILFISVNDHVPWGGSEVLWSETAKKLSSAHKVSALIKKWETEPSPILQLKNKGVKVFYKCIKKRQSFRNRVLKRLLKINTEKNINHELDALEQPDLVLISLGNHLEHKLFYYTDYLKSHEIPYAIIFQLVTDLRGNHDAVFNRFGSAFLNAEKIYFLSQDNLDKATMQFSVDLKNSELINNPFNYKTNYLPLEEEDSTIYNLGCVAALNSFHKGLDVFLKTLSAKKWIESTCKLIYMAIVPNKEQIKRLIALYGLQSKVVLHSMNPIKLRFGVKTKLW